MDEPYLILKHDERQGYFAEMESEMPEGDFMPVFCSSDYWVKCSRSNALLNCPGPVFLNVIRLPPVAYLDARFATIGSLGEVNDSLD